MIQPVKPETNVQAALMPVKTMHLPYGLHPNTLTLHCARFICVGATMQPACVWLNIYVGLMFSLLSRCVVLVLYS